MDHHGSTNPCDSYWVKKLKRDETGNIFFTLDFAAGILVHSDFMCRKCISHECPASLEGVFEPANPFPSGVPNRYAATPLRPQIKIAVKCLEMFHVPTKYLLSWQLTRIKGFCHLPASKILEMLEVVSVANKIWILIFVVKGRWDESGNLRQRYCDFLCSNSRIW